jgi:uncharacterized protein YutE (UPF0331/DUF86 family)
VDRVLIDQKLEALRHAVTRIADKCPPDAETLAAEEDLQDIVVLNLTRSIQLCVDVASHTIATSSQPAPATMGSAFTTLAQMGLLETELAERMRKAVGFRNIAVHNYERVDWNMVHQLASHNLEDFRHFAAAIDRQLNTPTRTEPGR